MAEGRECWDCFYCGERISSAVYKCNKTGRRVNGDDTCSNFLPEDGAGVHACYECDYFGTYKPCTILERENYCERKKKVVDPHGLACSFFVEG